MPIFYNTSEPTPGNKNTITDIATNFGIRDFLLNKKLQPRYPQIPTNVNGSPKIGEPVLDTVVGTNSNTTPDFSPIEDFGLGFKNENISTNTFKQQNNINELKDINYVQDLNNPRFGDAEWPHGTQQYPESATDELNSYGIVGKTNNAKFRELNTSKNEYLDVSEQIDVSGYLTENSIQITKQIDGYLNEYGSLNLGQTGGVQAANVIGSLLNGQGLGFSSEGLVTNFDLRSSLAGRALGLAGVLNDTELGIIGAQQLAIALGNNAAFNVQQEILGSLNIGENILNLIKDGSAPSFRPNYQITVPGSTLGRVADYTSRILGFTLPKSYLQESGSIFQYENGNIENITRANAMLDNTGKGQIKALITNVNGSLQGIYGTDNPSLAIFRSGYAAGYTNDRNIKSNDFNIYAYYNGNGTLINPLDSSDGVIPNLNVKNQKLSDYGFNDIDFYLIDSTRQKFTWGSVGTGLNTKPDQPQIFETVDNKKSLLRKTQLLFNSDGNRNIVSVKGDTQLTNSTQINSTNGATSKGSAVLKIGQYNGGYSFNGTAKGSADDIFCRSWVATNRYDSIGNLIRKSALLKNNIPYRTNRFNPASSVLEDTGFVRIAPYKTDFEENGLVLARKANVRNYMFSIENLAWADKYTDLPTGEQGPGDSTTGRKGRIMWFPPYDINFTENVSVQWESTNFIGRGEPIYTYNNTERTGTLSFSVIVDHPTYANTFKSKNNKPDDNYVASFFAGCCILPDESLTNEFIARKIREKITEKTEQTQNNSNISTEEKTTSKEEAPLQQFKIYFPNDYPTQVTENESVNNILNGGIGGNPNNRYESGFIGTGYTNKIDYTSDANGSGYGIGNYKGGFTSNSRNYEDGANFGLNGTEQQLKINGKGYNGPQDPDFFNDLKTYLNEKCTSCVIEITGFASQQGTSTTQQGPLALSRANAIKTYLMNNIGINQDKIRTLKTGVISTKDCIDEPGKRSDTEACKKQRYGEVSIKPDPNKTKEATTTALPQQTEPVITENEITRDSEGRYNFYNEINFFERLQSATCDDSEQGTSFIFDSFREKIRYFHPAFHSTTPEGLNSRLTFLHQCTRQGPTSEKQGATNLAFGRAPICILRIGDFFYTKIVIDSLSIDYEPLVWDLNPEGIGVQPMIAKITLGVKIIGGSSLSGPLNKLQNALSFNYYANTEVYDPRADYIEIDDSGEKGIIKNGAINDGGFLDQSTSKFQGGGGSGSSVGETKPLSFNISNQNEQANNQLNGETPSQSGTTAEPKITRIQTADWVVNPSSPSNIFFKLKLSTENLFDNNGNLLITDIDFNSFMSKGLKITLEENEPISGTEKIFYQETITDKTNENKDIFLNGRTIEIINKDLTIRTTNDFTLKINYPNTPQYNKNIKRVNLI